MSMAMAMIVRREGGVLQLINNNPTARNALTTDYYAALTAALDTAATDPDVGCLMLTGAAGFFCAGGDLKQLATRRLLSVDERIERIGTLHAVVQAIHACPKPVIAAVDGGAAGAGASLALACDLLVMADDAYLSLAYVKVGLSPDGGASTWLTQALPRQLVTQLLLTGESIGAKQLHALGVVNEVTEGSAEVVALRLAHKLAAGPQRAMTRIKRLVAAAPSNRLDQQLLAEAQSMAESLGDAEAAEGIAAFFDKRHADFAAIRRDA